MSTCIDVGTECTVYQNEWTFTMLFKRVLGLPPAHRQTARRRQIAVKGKYLIINHLSIFLPEVLRRECIVSK